MITSSAEYRGIFISEFSDMEEMIDRYLAKYFIKEKRSRSEQEIIEILIDRIPFESKRTALKFLVDKKDNEDFKVGKHGNKKQNHKALLEDIRKLAHIRNYFAHYIDCPFLSPNKVIAFIQFRDSANIIEYTKQELDELIDDIIKCKMEIISLMPVQSAAGSI